MSEYQNAFTAARLRALALVFAIVSFACSMPSASEAQVARPDQYVLLAFDGSQSLSMWKTTRDFAKRATLQNSPLKFTYFISGVYYVTKANKGKYIEPTRGAGVSAIGWGAGEADVLARYDQTNAAAEEKNEIASHAVAHFSGDKWSIQNWRDEFRQFHSIIFDFFKFNNLKPTAAYPTGWVFGEKSMVGFRAPQLGTSPGLWDTLRSAGYRYDTSKVDRANYWPQRDAKGGFWNFPLAQLVIAGTGKKTLSMDYNFYFADSKALPDPANKARYKKQMLETYLQYFENNYNGNRAPVHIGHHFSLWNDSAYWEAMQEFSMKVCGRPEVKCVTYTQLADFMDTVSPATLKAYQAGQFPKLPPTIVSDGLRPLDVDVRVALVPPGAMGNATSSNAVAVRLTGQDNSLHAGDRLEVLVNGKKIRHRSQGWIDVASLRRQFSGQDVAIETTVYRAESEIARSTQLMKSVGTVDESISYERDEDRALMGDLPEAHSDDVL